MLAILRGLDSQSPEGGTKHQVEGESNVLATGDESRFQKHPPDLQLEEVSHHKTSHYVPAQDPLISEYTLDHVVDPYVIYSRFLK